MLSTTTLKIQIAALQERVAMLQACIRSAEYSTHDKRVLRADVARFQRVIANKQAKVGA